MKSLAYFSFFALFSVACTIEIHSKSDEPAHDDTGWNSWDYYGGRHDWYGDGGAGGESAPFFEGQNCDHDGACNTGLVCNPEWICTAPVLGCPLTPVCLADPPGYEPPPVWLGIDPAYAGSLGDRDEDFIANVNLDFYDDHIYGEGRLTSRDTHAQMNVIVTGTREGNDIFGQIVRVDQNGGEREFDATFNAQLVSGSEITGEYAWWDDDGLHEGPLHWWRTSPCGCTPRECETANDCESGEACVDDFCHPDENSSGEGGGPGTDNETPDEENECSRTCECDLESECVQGSCVPREEQKKSCNDDCDCNHESGEHCIEGFCSML